MNITNLFLAIDNKMALLILLIVLIVFVALLAVLGVVFIVALRRRRPVVKVVMAPIAQRAVAEEAEAEEEPEEEEEIPVVTEEGTPVESPVPIMEEPGVVEEEDEEEGATFVTEGSERVRYDRSFTAKICQLSNEVKEWYSELKNELLSYEKIKDRMSWKRETFRLGRVTLARLVVRGKTLCLLTAVEPVSYSGTKYTVEDVSNMANTADTPTLYRIKSARRLKYAKEMIAGMMKEVHAYKKASFEPQDYFIPYDGDMSLIQRGLVKRVVSGSTRTFKVEEVDASEAEKVEENDKPTEEAASAPKTGEPKAEEASVSETSEPKTETSEE